MATAADGQALLVTLEESRATNELVDALKGVRSLLDPLLALGNDASVEVLRPIARTLGPLVTRLVKSMGIRLTPELRGSQLAEVLGKAACLGLDALDCLRPVIKASPHELDTQRYGFLRKLAALGLHELALAQGRVLHLSAASGPGSTVGPGDLHIAAVANLLVCYCELAQRAGDLASELWAWIGSAVDGLLCLARDAADAVEAGKRLEPVLKCLSKVVAALHCPGLVDNLGAAAVAHQLAAVVLCGRICRQEHAVKQMLMDDAAAAGEDIQAALLEGILVQLTEQGELPEALCCLLHQTALSLVQKRVGLPKSWPAAEHPLVVVMCAALQLPLCVLAPVPGKQQRQQTPLSALLVGLSRAAKALVASSEGSQQGDSWLRWCCLDVLRMSTASVQTQLLNAPQSAGGQLPALAQCMELLAHDCARLLDSPDSLDSTVLPCGCSAAAVACRLLAAHRMCTGQLAGLQEDVSRTMGQLRELLQASQRDGSPDSVGPSVLQSLSASLGNAGLDLLQAQHTAPAVELLQVAAELALSRSRLLMEAANTNCSSGSGSAAGLDMQPLVKKCKAHLVALQQLSDSEGVMVASASYVVQVHAHLGGDPHLLAPLVKLHVRASLVRAADVASTAAAAAAAATAPAPEPSGPSTPTAAATSGPAAPCKAPRRGGGRLQRMQAETQPQDVRVARSRARTGTGDEVGADETAPSVSSQPVPVHAAAVQVPLSLVQALAAAVQSGSAPQGLLGSLDLYAVQELEVAAEECRRGDEDGGLQQAHTASVLGALTRCASVSGSGAALQARVLLIKSMVAAGATPASQEADLRAACDLLDGQLAAAGQREEMQQKQGAATNLDESADILGLLDSAALAHAQLGVCLAQQQMAQRKCGDGGEPMEHVSGAIELWSQLLKRYAGDGGACALRMPQATLHAALQAQQLLHLLACSHVELAAKSGPVVWGIVGLLSGQVKLRDQHAYLLCATMPASTCLGWALAAQPHPPLAEAASAAQQHPKLAGVLELTQPIRDAHAFDPLDHVTLATTADACATELERSGFLRHGPTPLLLRSQCHQLAATAFLRAGDTANAYVQAQEALRITCGLFALLDGTAVDSGQVPVVPAMSGARTTASATPASSAAVAAARQHGPTPAEAAAAAVQLGAVTSAQDYAVQEEDEQQNEFWALEPLSGQAAVAAAADAAAARRDVGSGAPGVAAALGARQGQGISAGLGWAVVAAHLASLHQAARVFEAAGCVEDATCLWRECGRTAEAFGVVGVRVLSCCYLAEVSCRRGDLEAAEASLLEATAASRGLDGDEDNAGVWQAGEHGNSAETALLCADLSAARARCCLLRQRPGEVDEACSRGIAACDTVLISSRSIQHDGSRCPGGPVCMEAAVWVAACLRSQLERLRADAWLRLGRAREAAALLRDALGRLSDAASSASSSRTADAVWPVEHGLLLAHETSAAAAVAVAAAGSHRGARGSTVAALVVGLGRSEPAPKASCNTDVTMEEGTDAGDGRPRTDQATKRGAKSKAGATKAGAKGKVQSVHQDRHEQPLAPTPSEASASMSHSLPALLLSLQLCWQLPLAAAHACKQLLHAAMALGLPHAAAMFLHLGHGMSYAQQQQLQQQLRHRASQASPAQSSTAAASSVAAPGCTADDEDGGSPPGASGLCGARSVRDAAFRVLSGLGAGLGGGGARLAGDLVAALERGAACWLQQALGTLPAGAVVASIAQDCEADLVLLGRVTRGSVPVIVALSGVSTSTGATGGADCGGSASRVLDGCSAQLRGLLEESGDSMRMDQGASSSQSHKAQWWKARTSLDQSVSKLLRGLDEQCLGPWRCLLLPVPAAHRDVLLSAADAFASEHFPALEIDDALAAEEEAALAAVQLAAPSGAGKADVACARKGQRARVLRELLVVAMANMAHLQSSDVAALLCTICISTMGGPPPDKARLAALAVELAAAEAGVRVELLRLPAAAAVDQGSRVREEAPKARRPACAAVAAGTGRAAPGARARPGAGARPGATEGTRRAAAEVPSVGPEGMMGVDEVPSASGRVAPVPEAPGRGRRVPRLTAMQPEPSSAAAVTKAATRGAAARPAARGRGTAAVVVTQPAPQSPLSPELCGAEVPTPAAVEADRSVTNPGATSTHSSCPILLVLGPALHALPWESIPCLEGRDVYRILSLPVACNAASVASTARFATTPATDDTTTCAGPTAAGGQRGTRRGQLATGATVAAASSSSPASSVPPSPPSAYYLLNPSGDLGDTQRFFQPLLEAQPTWQGSIGEQPSARALLAALQTHALFLYFGHGSGEQFLPLPALRKLQRCAAAVLMGCSSGRLRLHGAYDPSGAAAAYLLAGCPALVANLWDVTDRDIDRYCQALLRSWLGCSEPQRPEACGESGPVDGGAESLACAVASSRGACKLRHLIGAAPVCYGLPLQL